MWLILRYSLLSYRQISNEALALLKNVLWLRHQVLEIHVADWKRRAISAMLPSENILQEGTLKRLTKLKLFITFRPRLS